MRYTGKEAGFVLDASEVAFLQHRGRKIERIFCSYTIFMVQLMLSILEARIQRVSLKQFHIEKL